MTSYQKTLQKEINMYKKLMEEFGDDGALSATIIMLENQLKKESKR